ncbi:MAG TPA: protein kinase [Gemmatimonadaceae bacterium]|nr:protein kinase [Gemmatimonadaceae bacterium]
MTETQYPDIGKYKIVELVGEGAMGVVYRGRDTVLDRSVAIKVMNEAIARQDDLRRRFLHEAQAAASLQHPNVVTIFDLGDVEGHLFIAMEFVEGIDLEKLMESGQLLSLQAKLDIMIDVLTGLSFAHKRGIIHRDIKPANIRVTGDGRAKIMDFGVAHLSSSSMTTTGSLLGTPSYMAPEQITEGKTTEQTDIFAVGGVLYQLLTNMKPFEGPTLQNLFFRIITEDPKPVSALMPNLPKTLDGIVQKAMAKDPKDRYASALVMANELSAVRAKLSGPSYPESVSLSASVSSAIEQARKKAETRSRNFAIAGVAALAAVVLLIVWSEFGRRNSNTNAPVAAAQTTPRDSAPPVATTPVNAQPPATEASRSTALPTPVSTPSAPKTERTRETTRNTRTATQQKAAPEKPTPPRVAANQSARQSALPTTSNNTVTQAPAQSAPIQQPVVTTPQQQLVVQKPVETPKETPPPPPPAPKPATASDLSPVVDAYARAIESKDMAAVRRIYPNITASQARGLLDFFQRAKNLNVTFRIEDLSSTTTTAEAMLAGRYEYVTSDNESKRDNVSVAASFQRDGNVWRLTAIH